MRVQAVPPSRVSLAFPVLIVVKLLMCILAKVPSHLELAYVRMDFNGGLSELLERVLEIAEPRGAGSNGQ